MSTSKAARKASIKASCFRHGDHAGERCPACDLDALKQAWSILDRVTWDGSGGTTFDAPATDPSFAIGWTKEALRRILGIEEAQ